MKWPVLPPKPPSLFRDGVPFAISSRFFFFFLQIRYRRCGTSLLNFFGSQKQKLFWSPWWAGSCSATFTVGHALTIILRSGPTPLAPIHFTSRELGLTPAISSLRLPFSRFPPEHFSGSVCAVFLKPKIPFVLTPASFPFGACFIGERFLAFPFKRGTFLCCWPLAESSRLKSIFPHQKNRPFFSFSQRKKGRPFSRAFPCGGF